MPRLILFRHASAEPQRPRGTDHERPLTKGGRKEAKQAGRTLAKRGETIDLVLSSDSQRTRETWEDGAKEIDVKPEVRYLRSLFETHDYLPIIVSEGGDADTLVVVGHNPAIHAAAVGLAESLAGRYGKKLAAEFAKGALAIFDFSGEWAALRPGRMQLVAYIEPGD